MQDDRIFNLFQNTLSKYATAVKDKQQEWEDLTNAMQMKHNLAYTFYYFLGSYADVIANIWKTGIFSNGDFFSLVPAEDAETLPNDEQCKRAEAKIKRQMKNAKLSTKLKELLNTMSYLGSRVGKVIWDNELDQPNFWGVSNNDTFVDPTRPFCKQRIKIIRERIDYGTLLLMQEDGLLQDVDKIKSAYTTGKTATSNYKEDPIYKASGIDKDKLDVPSDDKIADGNQYIYQMWVQEIVTTGIDSTGKEVNEVLSDKCYIIEPSTKEILSIPPHNSPYAARKYYKDPYVIGRSNPVEGLCWGKSPVWKLLPEQKIYNRTLYDEGRTFDLAVQGIFFLELGHKIDIDTIYKGKITLVHNLTQNTFRSETIPPVLVSLAFQRIQQIKANCDEMMSIWAMNRGSGTGVHMTKTASGLAMAKEESNVPRKDEIENIQIELLTDIVNQWLLLDKENATIKTRIRKMENVLDSATGQTVEREIEVEQEANDPDFQFDFEVSIKPPKEFGMEAIKISRMDAFTTKWANNPFFKQYRLAAKETLAVGLDPNEVMEKEQDVPVKEENAQLRQAVAKYEQATQMLSDKLKEWQAKYNLDDEGNPRAAGQAQEQPQGEPVV